MRRAALIFFICAVVASGDARAEHSSSGPSPVIYLGERPYYDLFRYIQGFQLSYEWNPFANRVHLYRGKRTLTFLMNEPFASVDGKVYRLEDPPRMWRARPLVPSEMLNWAWWREVLAQEKISFPDSAEPFVIDRIVVDPGHGGSDPGAIGPGGLQEKDVALSFAHHLAEELQAKGISVILTREEDRAVPLAGRTDLANRSNADLLVSVHANAASDRDASGYELYYLTDSIDDAVRVQAILEKDQGEGEENPDLPNKLGRDPTLWDLVLSENRAESLELARFIDEELRGAGSLASRGVQSASYHALRMTDKPAVLIELGFLTNPQDASRLADPAFLRALARGVARGILRYGTYYEATYGFTRPEP